MPKNLKRTLSSSSDDSEASIEILDFIVEFKEELEQNNIGVYYSLRVEPRGWPKDQLSLTQEDYDTAKIIYKLMEHDEDKELKEIALSVVNTETIKHEEVEEENINKKPRVDSFWLDDLIEKIPFTVLPVINA